MTQGGRNRFAVKDRAEFIVQAPWSEAQPRWELLKCDLTISWNLLWRFPSNSLCNSENSDLEIPKHFA